jgi:hypothetical protein
MGYPSNFNLHSCCVAGTYGVVFPGASPSLSLAFRASSPNVRKTPSCGSIDFQLISTMLLTTGVPGLWCVKYLPSSRYAILPPWAITLYSGLCYVHYRLAEICGKWTGGDSRLLRRLPLKKHFQYWLNNKKTRALHVRRRPFSRR